MLGSTEYTAECVRNALDAAEVTGGRNLAVLAAEVRRQRTDIDQMAAEIERLGGEVAEMDEGRRSAITLWQMAVRSQSTPPNRQRLAEIIAEKMGHERSDDSPTCMDEDTTLGCRHAGGHPAEPGCDTCCEYGWPCAPALAAADAVLAAAHIVVPRSPVAVSTSVDGMSPAEWDARERVRRDGALAD